MKKITTITQYIEDLRYYREPCHVLDFINNNIDANGTVHFAIKKVTSVPYMIDDYYKIGVEMSLFIMSGNEIPILNMDMVYCIETFVEECGSDELNRTLFVEIPTSHIADIQQAISCLTSRSGYDPPYAPRTEDFDFLQIFEDNRSETFDFPIVGNQFLS